MQWPLEPLARRHDPRMGDMDRKAGGSSRIVRGKAEAVGSFLYHPRAVLFSRPEHGKRKSGQAT